MHWSLIEKQNVTYLGTPISVRRTSKKRNMKKILVIEDNADILENIAEMLQLANYDVLVAPDGKAGLETAFSEMPDIILCDIVMPILDGYGVLQSIQNNETTKNIPFIFLTARTEKSDIRLGIDLGARAYLTKPFTIIELLDAIEDRI